MNQNNQSYFVLPAPIVNLVIAELNRYGVEGQKIGLILSTNMKEIPPPGPGESNRGNRTETPEASNDIQPGEPIEGESREDAPTETPDYAKIKGWVREIMKSSDIIALHAALSNAKIDRLKARLDDLEGRAEMNSWKTNEAPNATDSRRETPGSVIKRMEELKEKPEPLIEDRILTTREAAEFIGVSRRTIYRWVREGLPCTGNSTTGFEIKESTLIAWHNKNRKSKGKGKADLDTFPAVGDITKERYMEYLKNECIPAHISHEKPR